MKIAIVPVSIESRKTARRLLEALPDEAKLLARGEVKDTFHDYDAFVFVSALGICVRTIAPYIEDKYTDPAVICVDSTGKNVIAVLSGHKGGEEKMMDERVSLEHGMFWRVIFTFMVFRSSSVNSLKISELPS